MSTALGHGAVRFADLPGIRAAMSSADALPTGTRGLRVQDSRSLLRRIWPLRSRLGISRVADITELDVLGIPVVSAIRPLVNASQITATQGKGLRALDSTVSALMEAVERHAGAQPHATISRSIKALLKTGRGGFVPPERLGARKAPQDAKIDWIESRGLLSGEGALLPAAEVLFPFHPSKGALRPVRPSTTGLSAGSTLLEAALHALFEVVERDRVSRFKRSGVGARMLDLSSVKTPIERGLLETFRSRDLRVLVCDLSEGSPVPVFLVGLIDQVGIGPPMYMAGQGAHFSPELALRRALLEAAQSRVVALQGSREDLIRHSSEYGRSWAEVNREFDRVSRRVSSCGRSSFRPAREKPLSIIGAIQKLTDALRKSGYDEIYCTDLTRKEIGIPVVHVSVLGMIDSVVEPGRRRIRRTP